MASRLEIVEARAVVERDKWDGALPIGDIIITCDQDIGVIIGYAKEDYYIIFFRNHPEDTPFFKSDEVKSLTSITEVHRGDQRHGLY